MTYKVAQNVENVLEAIVEYFDSSSGSIIGDIFSCYPKLYLSSSRISKYPDIIHRFGDKYGYMLILRKSLYCALYASSELSHYVEYCDEYPKWRKQGKRFFVEAITLGIFEILHPVTTICTYRTKNLINHIDKLCLWQL